MKFFLTTFCFFWGYVLSAQQCTTLGQSPTTAFPVCGTNVFQQTTVPVCGGSAIPGPCNGVDQITLRDLNPYWYRFTCFQSGSLGFTITPANLGDDYDWQIFDITNQNPNDVFTNAALFVSCNWSGSTGITGASSAGSQRNVCATTGQHPNQPLFSSMPTIQQGHTYLLLISHFSGDNQSGYKLAFNGGSAVITDPTQPGFKQVEASCGGDIIRLKLNKKVKCSSLTTSGSDFSISPGAITVASAVGIGCNTGFDTDSIELRLNGFLPPGTYSLNASIGTDGNTLLDLCDNSIPLTEKINFTVFPLAPTPMDSMLPVSCKPQSLRLVFRKPILCSSVATDGSDFVISGSYPVTVTGATGGCSAGSTTSKQVIINLSQPLYQNGNFTLTLKNGSDGNTLLDECGQQTPAGSFLLFGVKDTVNADFSFQKFYGCTYDTVNCFHPGANGVNSWLWTFGENKTSSLQNPQVLYSLFNQKTIKLVVNNGFCADTSSQTVLLDNFLKADFSGFDDNCPNEATSFTSTAQGHIVQYSWSFGDGGTAAVPSPSHVYAGPIRTTPFIVTFTITDSLGCQSSKQKTIRIYSSCFLAVPSAFTPNNDGLNDFLAPLNAVKAEKLDFKVFNRWGQLIFQTNNWKHGWDGTVKGIPQGTDIYVWYLTYVDRDTKESRQMKGTAALIR
ncbi:MAG: PKD domain-containing protein [Flavisolibacter sp.]